MQSAKAKMLRYALLPEILPRLKVLFASGFGYIAYLIALIFHAVRLLPDTHPYLHASNIGRFGIRHVIAQAANNLELRSQNADQVFIFFTILIGIVLLVLQFVLLIFSLVAQQPAIAQSFTELFSTNSIYNPGTSQDLALMVLDRVFGVVRIFESCVSTAVPCLDLEGNPIPGQGAYPFPSHIALHALLRFYSLGLFVVSVIIILYIVTAIVAETASTGTPFGQRYNKAWAPLRLIVFLALLVPLNIGTGQNEGLNSAQIITLWVAKSGSNFATNAWSKFNQDLTRESLIDAQSLVATPNIPAIAGLHRFMFLTRVCRIAEEVSYGPASPYIRPYVVRGNRMVGAAAGRPTTIELLPATYAAAAQFSDYGTISIVFGEYDEDRYQNYKGSVRPSCGEIVIRVRDVDEGGSVLSGSSAIQEVYFNMVKNMWRDTLITGAAECLVRRTISGLDDPGCVQWPTKRFINAQNQRYQNQLQAEIPNAIQLQIDNGDWNVPETLLQKGWAGAGIWYNRIAEVNGAVTAAVLDQPAVVLYPAVMEKVAYERSISNEDFSPDNMYDPVIAGEYEIQYDRYKDSKIAQALYASYYAWEEGKLELEERPRNDIVIDAINLIFGTSGIFEMRRNTDIHPLAQLSSLGKGLMEAALRNIAVGMGGNALISIFGGSPPAVVQAMLSFLSSMGFATIMFGFILYYIVPFLPFLYMLFALSGWVKSIFEAIVAMPLWAMAHLIRVEGDGLPGPAASDGYLLLLEIFLRPILTLFGFLASISIFAAMVQVLNEIFTLVVSVVGGHDPDRTLQPLTDFVRSPIDEFFFTAVYVIIVYIIGMSSFKLIDMIPQQILRYMGGTVPTFQESDKDLPEGVVQKTYTAGLLATGKLQGGTLAALLG